MLYLIVAMAAGIGTSKVTTDTVARSWRDCDAAGPGDGWILLLMWVPNAVAVGVWWMVVLLLGHRLGTRVPALIRLPVTLLVCLSGSLAVLWAMVAWLHDPGGTIVHPVCPPGNTPPWWPTWVPL